MPDASDNVVIRAASVGKRYKIGVRDGTKRSLGETVVHALGAPLRRLRNLGERSDGSDAFWALRDIGFEVRQGEVVGVIGANGAGKSTLLKILSRITEPTTGRVELRGKVRSLLEVGTGFHPELTGRENVYLNGAILGLRKVEIDALFDQIVAFAEIDRFLDTPVKRYSSGMYVRLAFAVAAHLQPDILIVDEVLAVGDTAFQAKCLGTMRDVARSGRTVLFVSHNLAAVSRLCSRGIVLADGQMVCDAPTDEAIKHYLVQNDTTTAEAQFERDPSRPVQITRVAIHAIDGTPTGQLEGADGGEIRLRYDVRQWEPGSTVAVTLNTDAGTRLTLSVDVGDKDELWRVREPGEYAAAVRIPPGVLVPGSYFVDAAIYHPGKDRAYCQNLRCVRFDVTGHRLLLTQFGVKHPALINLPLEWRTERVSRDAPELASVGQ